jgi:DNA-binding NtrC family response regulator
MSKPSRFVLVVEDESAQRAMYEKAVAQLGYHVHSVRDGASARRAIGESEFAIVLLDLNLGGESGMDLFENIRETHPAVSVVIATGFGTYEIARRAISMDVVEFLSKPVSLNDLEAALARAWDRHVLVNLPAEQLANPEAGTGSDFAGFRSLRIEDVERALLVEALRRSEDNRAVAAKLLGISERKLYYLLSRMRP